MTTDVILNTDRGYNDFDWTESGDISTDQMLDTAIKMSIFEEVRATAQEIPVSNKRRGWIGNETTPDFEQGSKSWLFEQERLTGSVLAELGVVVRNGLQWLIDDDIAVSVIVEQPFLSQGKICVYINLGRDGSKVDRKLYEVWDNTGKNF
ncbi:MAG: phage GP46 family protein, partial [Candidatus Aminicenantes bacterium]|nr:phage GP46 family protein [Candidatus Aminicenantes bacterium]